MATNGTRKNLLNQPEAERCYVPGCYEHATKEKCPGIPSSNECASCRKKKNYLGVEG